MQFCEATGLVGIIVEKALGVIDALGYLGAILIVMIENILPFIPSEVILPAIGFATVNGAFYDTGIIGIALSVLVVTFASVLGAIILFTICRKIGVDRVAKIPFVEKEGLVRAEKAFEKHGSLAVMICRIMPVVRVLVTIPAGLSQMKLGKFVLFTTLGSLIWNIFLVGVGAAMGSQWCSLEPLFSKYSKLTLIVVVVLFVLALIVKKKVLNKKS
jgi:membrane protein DedA with SNARE-associated domain